MSTHITNYFSIQPFGALQREKEWSYLAACLSISFLLLTLYLFVAPFAFFSPSQLKVYPSLESLIVADNARLSELKRQADELYPTNIFGTGHSVLLPKGRVKYWLIGPVDGKKVALIHGLTAPSLIWKGMAEKLAGAGFRVLLYDLYARGHSEAPDPWTTSYDTELYITQLALLMQAIGWPKARIAELSMGGGIAAAFAAKFPWLVESNVVLIGSAGVMEGAIVGVYQSIFGSLWFQRIRHSAIGKALFTPALPPLVDLSLPDGPQHRRRLKALHSLQIDLLPGYATAVVASAFIGPCKGLEKEFKQLGELSGVKVQIIWGTEDVIVPFRYAKKINRLIPHAELVTVKDAGHVSDMFTNHPEFIAKSLIGFLDS